MSDQHSTIKPLKDGPYLVTNLTKLANKNGTIEAAGSYALCRCGGSSNKPFCDGTHKSINFSSDKIEGRIEDKVEDYIGEDITIHDNRGICAHAGKCSDGLPEVFRYKKEPWIIPDGANAESVSSTVSTCPSGALGVRWKNGTQTISQDKPNIEVMSNGPYNVTGSPELIVSEMGHRSTNNNYALCRCGGSKNKPFCDGSHWSNGFDDPEN